MRPGGNRLADSQIEGSGHHVQKKEARQQEQINKMKPSAAGHRGAYERKRIMKSPKRTATNAVMQPPSADAGGGQSAPRSPDNEELLRRLRTAATIIGTKLSWRRLRDLSLDVYRTLKKIVAPDIAYRVARALTGVPPEHWLAVSEAQKALAALGVKVSRRFLHRRARTARRAGGRTLELILNSKRQWSGPSPVLIPSPIVRLRISCDGQAIRFRVERLA